jgi:hypothetical protein
MAEKKRPEVEVSSQAIQFEALAKVGYARMDVPEMTGRVVESNRSG